MEEMTLTLSPNLFRLFLYSSDTIFNRFIISMMGCQALTYMFLIFLLIFCLFLLTFPIVVLHLFVYYMFLCCCTWFVGMYVVCWYVGMCIVYRSVWWFVGMRTLYRSVYVNARMLVCIVYVGMVVC